MSDSASKQFLIYENILNDMLHDAVLWLYLDLQIYHLLVVSLLKGGKIANI